MPVYRTKQSRYEEVQKRMRETQPRFESTYANIELASTEHEVAILQYRKRVFRVPPVPYREGLWLLALDQELRRMQTLPATESNIKHSIEVTLDMVTVFHRLVRPLTKLDRLLWRWRENPFLHAEINEIFALKNFFCTTRTSTPISGLVAIRAPLFIQRTWPMPKPYLPIGIHAGWHRPETHAAGDTT